MVTEKQLLVIKYNFVALRIEECRRINLERIDKIQSGKFVFPKYSMMTLVFPFSSCQMRLISYRKGPFIFHTPGWNRKFITLMIF